MTKRNRFILAGFVLGLLVELWITYGMAHPLRIRDRPRPDSWYVWQLSLSGILLVAMTTVLRIGSGWQRLVALALCICPTIIVLDWCQWSLRQLSTP